jgi:RHS repeat-associated protein
MAIALIAPLARLLRFARCVGDSPRSLSATPPGSSVSRTLRALPHWSSFVLHAFAAVALLAPLVASAAPMVWYKDGTKLYQVDGATKALVRSLTYSVSFVSADGDGGAWFTDRTYLRRVDSAGVIRVEQTLSSLQLGAGYPIAADPRDGSLWYGNGTSLAHVSTAGQVVQRVTLPASASAVVVGYDHTVYVLTTGKELVHLSAAGAIQSRDPVTRTSAGLTRAVAVDPLSPTAWVTTWNETGGYNYLLKLDYSVSPPMPTWTSTSAALNSLAVDPVTGDVWGLGGATGNPPATLLSHFSPTGALIQNFFPSASSTAVGIDPNGGTVWLGQGNGVRAQSTSGTVLADVVTGSQAYSVSVSPFRFAPTLALLAPSTQTPTSNQRPTFTLQYGATCYSIICAAPASRIGTYTLSATLDSIQIGSSFSFNATTQQASYTPGTALVDGAHPLSATITDRFGQVSSTASGTVTVDTVAPTLVDVTPANNARVTQSALSLSGHISEAGTVQLGSTAVSGPAFTLSTTLSPGANTLPLTLTDLAGNSTPVSLSYNYMTVAVSAPSNGASVSTSTVQVSGSFTGPSGTTVSVNGVAATITGTNYSATVPLVNGSNTLTVTVTSVGTSVTKTITVTSTAPTVPTLTAPAVDKTVASTLANTTAFLYSASNPVQTGVSPGTIEAKRAAVVRGKVITRDGTVLPGVTVTILNHPEFGQTVSRADGMFDMAVNGGGPLTINYQLSGYLPVQRQVNTRWQDFSIASDIVLVPLDAKVTTVDLASNAMQVARGNPVTDSDGTRQSTVLFPAGTVASMVKADGTTQALSTLSVRATEYTVGANGPKAMPGPLPPTSGYTYAVELSVDEAIAAGARSVTFSQPVYHYVENFLNFPVGGIVPSGYYDRMKAAWMPSTNGRVIKVLDIANGLATLDTDGDGVADSAAQLAALNISDVERQQIATLYAANATLWRVPIDHFTPWDHNWPYGPPPGSRPPTQPKPKKDVPCDSCEVSGSIIEVQNQTLGEAVPIAGTSVLLSYRSDRTPGRNSRTLIISLTGSEVPAGVRGIELEIEIAGKLFLQTFPATPNQQYTFNWDGRDAYSRVVVGSQPVTVRVGYAYDVVYLAPNAFSSAFAAFGTTPTISRSTYGVTLWQVFKDRLTAGLWAGNEAAGLGGWTLAPHHAYDPIGSVLSMGDGRKRRAEDLSKVIVSVGGKGSLEPADGIPATDAAFEASGVLAAPDGSIYVGSSAQIWRIGADGRLTRIAGREHPGATGYGGDGGPATSALISYGVIGMAIAQDGSLYFADIDNNRVRRIGPDGSISTIAGTGSAGFSGDGGPATSAQLYCPDGIALAADGTLYIADICNVRIRRVSPDGIITTYAGSGQWDSTGDGGPASLAAIQPRSLALSEDGSLYFTDDGHYIRKISPDGIVSSVAGTGGFGGYSGDGGPAKVAAINLPSGIAVGADGAIYFGDHRNRRVRRIGPDGIIATVAGNGTFASTGDGGPAIAASIGGTMAVSLAADGSVLHAGGVTVPNTVRQVRPVMPSFSLGEIAVASEDGSQVFKFDGTGRHLRTLDARTGASLYSFAYTSTGLLDAITDAAGNTVKIQRDSNGVANTIVAPDGQATTLGYDANGWLSSITDPMNQAYSMSYTTDGLMLTFTNPRQKTSTMQYDWAGRLQFDGNAASGSWTLIRVDDDIGSTVTMTSAETRASSYRIEALATGAERRINTWADGTQTVILRGANGTTTATRADGSTVTTTSGADPRFGMQAPITTSAVVQLPSGLTQNVSTTRTATLSNPSDLLSLTQETTTLKINGRPFVAAYAAASRTYATTSAQGRTSSVVVDTVGRPQTVTIGDLAAVTYGYDTRGRLHTVTQGTGDKTRSLTYDYGTDGYLQKVTDALTNSVVYQRDLVGRPLQTTLPGNRIFGATFDANSNVSTLTPPGKTAHGFTFDAVDLERKYTPPAIPNVSDPATYTDFNKDKGPTSLTLPDGSSLTLSYDSTTGQLKTITPSAGAGNPVGLGYSSTTGQLKTASNADATVSVDYDGPLAKQEALTGSIAGSIVRGFDTDFRVNQLTVNGTGTTYGYDNDSLLTQAGALTLTRYPANGLLSGTTLGSVNTSHGYNTFGELETFGATYGSTALLSYTLSYDNAGRIKSKTETVTGVTTNYDYGYEAAGRLKTVSQNGTELASYDYDGNGNRTALNGATIASYDAQDRLQTYGSATYAFTANGALKTKTQGTQATQYGYDIFGNLKTVDLPGGTHVDYLVDGLNRRIGKKVDGVVVQGFVYQDQLRIAAELDGTNNVIASFVYGEKPNVPEYMVKGGVTYRIITDHLGSVRLVVDTATGAIAQRIDYDAWGTVTSDSNPGFQPFGYAGGLYDQHTRFVRFGARDYEAQTGRWTSKDPLGFGGGDSELYSYARNQPTHFVDPDGREPLLSIAVGLFGVYQAFAGGCQAGMNYHFDQLCKAQQIESQRGEDGDPNLGEGLAKGAATTANFADKFGEPLTSAMWGIGLAGLGGAGSGFGALGGVVIGLAATGVGAVIGANGGFDGKCPPTFSLKYRTKGK